MTRTVFYPAFRFTSSKSQLAVVWSSCAKSPLAKRMHWPRCPKRRNSWCMRRLPLKCDWQLWNGTDKAFQSSWQRPGKGREEALDRTLFNVCNYKGGNHYTRIYCKPYACQTAWPSIDRKLKNLEGKKQQPVYHVFFWELNLTKLWAHVCATLHVTMKSKASQSESSVSGTLALHWEITVPCSLLASRCLMEPEASLCFCFLVLYIWTETFRIQGYYVQTFWVGHCHRG